MVPAPLAIIASFAGGRLAYGTGSWMPWPPVMTPLQMIDTSVVWVHQHGACITDNNRQDIGRSRGGSTNGAFRHFGVPARANPFGAKIVAFVRAGGKRPMKRPRRRCDDPDAGTLASLR
jgi:hypothetical protein